MDATYMTQLQELIRSCNRELDRAQEMNLPPDISFLQVLHRTEEEWSEAGRRFSAKHGIVTS